MDSDVIGKLSHYDVFSFADYCAVNQDCGIQLGESSMRKKLHSLIQDNLIVRVGRNAFCVPKKKVQQYHHEYSELACETASLVQENYPMLDFTISELVQLNEFLNHQLAHNTVFLSVEGELSSFVFETLKEHFPGKVLLEPSLELYHQYWYDDMIVIGKLVTEAPMGTAQHWHTRLEKLLVDLISENILKETISQSEFPSILESAFDNYVIVESTLFYYAKRRGVEKHLRAFIHENTSINLKTER